MAVLWPNMTVCPIKYKTRVFKIQGQDIDSTLDNIAFDHVTGNLQISTASASANSPFHKMAKINTPTKNVHKKLFSDISLNKDQSPNSTDSMDVEQPTSLSKESEISVDPDCCGTEFTDISVTVEDQDTLTQITKQLQDLLPAVTAHLSEYGRLEEWVAFFKLINSGDFDVNHIASQLFWDVVKFIQVGNIHAMRFSPEVKEFWTVGMSLFHAKFIRFMGGYKAIGLLTDGSERNRKSLVPDISRVNFICPEIKSLREEKKKHKIGCEKPGIILSNIKALENSSCDLKSKSYKLCIDGKKISAGFGKKLGEVDLFGHESAPTLLDKQNRLNAEEMMIADTLTAIDHALELEKENIYDLNMDARADLHRHAVDIISVITYRIKELRFSKVQKNHALDKLIKMAGEQWQKSTYSYAISKVKTQLHRIDMCIDDALKVNQKLGIIASSCQSMTNVCRTDNIVDLGKQENYVCLKEHIQTIHSEEIDSCYIKQRTQAWFDKRKKAKATGSTLYRAIGLSTLKEQQIHFDKLGCNKSLNEVDFPESVKLAMKHGTENEINAIGTIVNQVIPVYEKNTKFYEEGCYSVSNSDDPDFIIVSPDGSCRTSGVPVSAVEIKCPVPGKVYTPDVHYMIPEYYVCQILSEMTVLSTSYLLYVCWTPKSTTVLRADYDETLWHAMVKELARIYCPINGNPERPKRKSPNVMIIKEMIRTYLSEKVVLLGEFPSNISLQCNHTEGSMTGDNLRGLHGYSSEERSEESGLGIAYKIHAEMGNVRQVIMRAENCLHEMYNVVRIPAKEVLVAVLSDLDRTKTQEQQVQAIPIAYGLSGYSLKVEAVRSIIHELIEVCHQSSITVRSVSSDGQFYKLCVRSADNKPLTILQLAKDTWVSAKKMKKEEIIRLLMSLNYKQTGSESIEDTVEMNYQIATDTHVRANNSRSVIVYGWKGVKWPKLYNPRRLTELISQKTRKLVETQEDATLRSEAFESLPPEVLNDLASNVIDDQDLLDVCQPNINAPDVMEVQESEAGVQNVPDEVQSELTEANIETEIINDNSSNASEVSYDEMIKGLQEIDNKRKKPKWSKLTKETLKTLLSAEPKTVMDKFTKDELQICGAVFREAIELREGITVETMTKMSLVNAFSRILGNKMCLAPKKSPKKLRMILKDYLSRKFGKDALNAVAATYNFLNHDLPKWRKSAFFKDGMHIDDYSAPYIWYSKPEYFSSVGEHIVYLLDCHHLFVNARCYVCQNGISGLGVKKEAWVAIAKSKSNKQTGLNIAIVRDMIDRQSNAIAQIVFSENVEREMRKTGWLTEATFCAKIRNWYRAEDEPGLDVKERQVARIALRTMLLESVNLAEFPPPGNHVAGMPVVMFEGILTNIDRRIQLYALTPGNSYNVRAPNTLDIENLFSEFQELDPKSSGALMPDDIPTALETASYIMQQRLNPDR